MLARTDLSPDDLLALPDGSVWVTDPAGGSIEHLTPDGHVLALHRGRHEDTVFDDGENGTLGVFAIVTDELHASRGLLFHCGEDVSPHRLNREKLGR